MVLSTGYIMAILASVWCVMTMNEAKVITDMKATGKHPISSSTVEQLVQDFKADIERLRGEQHE